MEMSLCKASQLFVLRLFRADLEHGQRGCIEHSPFEHLAGVCEDPCSLTQLLCQRSSARMTGSTSGGESFCRCIGDSFRHGGRVLGNESWVDEHVEGESPRIVEQRSCLDGTC